MANYRQRGNRWQARVRRNGYPDITKSFTTKTAAQKWARKTEGTMDEYKHVATDEERARTVNQAIDRYWNETGQHQKDWKHVKQRLKFWRESIGEYSLVYLEQHPDLVADGKSKLLTSGRARSTVNRYLAALGAVLKEAHKEWQWIETNPMRRISHYKEPEHRECSLEVDELRAILDACKSSTSPALYPIACIGAYTGARLGEASSFKWRDLDLKAGTIRFTDTKNGSDRTVFLFGEVLTALQDWDKVRDLKSQYVFPGKTEGSYIDIKRSWRTAADNAGHTGLRFHDLRHAAAAFLDRAGCTPAQIAKVLGHKTLAMVSRYTFVNDNVTRDATEKMHREVFGNG